MIYGAIAVGAGLVGAFLLGQWWGWRNAQQYLIAAQAVQAITESSFEKMSALVGADAQSAKALESNRVHISALDDRLKVIGAGLEGLSREVATSNIRRGALNGYATKAVDDDDPTL